RRLRDFNSLEEILGDRIEYALRTFVQDLGERDPAEVAAGVRKCFGLSAHEPVRDLCGLLEARGIKVLPLRIASDAFFGLSVGAADGGPGSAVNTHDPSSVSRRNC